MAIKTMEDKMVHYVLRILQLMFAFIVMGTDGYAIHTYQGHTVYIHSEFGNYYAYYSVPDAWGFLMFCAGWTVLSVTFHFLTQIISASRPWIGYVHIAVETVAVLSWLAGFIAVAVQISTDVCRVRKSSCGPLMAATVFGALEWLLFMVTAALTVRRILKSSPKEKSSSDSPVTAV